MASGIREKIVDAAWELFREKGYGETTINDIIRKADISKGTFYYYFRSKDNMLDTLSEILDREYENLESRIPADISKGTFYYYFRSKDNMLDTLSEILDREYENLESSIPADMNSFDKLMLINYEVHSFIEKNIDYRLLAYLYSAQIIKEHNSSLLDRNRYYFRFLEQIMNEGSKKGELTDDMTVTEMVKFFGFGERALITDWCMNNGSYSLGEYSREMFPKMMMALKKDSSAN